MPKRVLSFRINDSELAILQGLQLPEDTSLGQTALRVLRGAMGIDVDAVDADPVSNRLESAIPDRELIRDEINERTAYLANAMNEVKNSLEGEIEALKTRLAQQEKLLGES